MTATRFMGRSAIVCVCFCRRLLHCPTAIVTEIGRTDGLAGRGENKRFASGRWNTFLLIQPERREKAPC